MKTFLKSLSLVAALTAASAATAAAPSATSLDQLLDQVRNASQQNAAVNQQREQEFKAKYDQQAQILATAQQVLQNEQARNATLQASYDKNVATLNDLVSKLRSSEGDFSQVVDNARQVASDFKTTLDSSLVSAQYPGRGVFLAKLAESRNLPSLEDIRKLWFLMQQEMTEEGKVTKFAATITHEDGAQEKVNVVRVGEFAAVNGNSFLRYVPETGALVQPDRQPGGHFRGLAGDLSAAGSGTLPMAVDPTGGELLRTLVNQPSTMEQVAQGHTVGWIILVFGLAGLLIIVERGLYLLSMGNKIKVQMSSSKPDLNNPLGRILTTFNESKSDDTETLGLRLDETLMRERPVIEARLGLLRVLALVAVLLGLLGTIVGVMNTFQTMNLFGSGAALVANGIAAALVPLWLGLLVATTLLFFHGLLTARSEALVHTLEEQSAGILAARAEKLSAMKGAK